MLKFLHKLFNHEKISELNATIEIYKERNNQLENEVREYKGYKLKYEVTKLYVEDDDEALLELFDIAKTNDRRDAAEQMRSLDRLGLLRSSANGEIRHLGGLEMLQTGAARGSLGVDFAQLAREKAGAKMKEAFLHGCI